LPFYVLRFHSFAILAAMEEKEGLAPPVEAVRTPEKEGLLSVAEVARKVGRSTHRIRRLLNTGKIEGEKRRRESKKKGFPWIWFTTEKAVSAHFSSVLTPREYGKRGGRPRKAAGAA